MRFIRAGRIICRIHQCILIKKKVGIAIPFVRIPIEIVYIIFIDSDLLRLRT